MTRVQESDKLARNLYDGGGDQESAEKKKAAV